MPLALHLDLALTQDGKIGTKPVLRRSRKTAGEYRCVQGVGFAFSS